jgi:hypothetical protein
MLNVESKFDNILSQNKINQYNNLKDLDKKKKIKLYKIQSLIEFDNKSFDFNIKICIDNGGVLLIKNSSNIKIKSIINNGLIIIEHSDCYIQKHFINNGKIELLNYGTLTFNENGKAKINGNIEVNKGKIRLFNKKSSVNGNLIVKNGDIFIDYGALVKVRKGNVQLSENSFIIICNSPISGRNNSKYLTNMKFSKNSQLSIIENSYIKVFSGLLELNTKSTEFNNGYITYKTGIVKFDKAYGEKLIQHGIIIENKKEIEQEEIEETEETKTSEKSTETEKSSETEKTESDSSSNSNNTTKNKKKKNIKKSISESSESDESDYSRSKTLTSEESENSSDDD